MKYEPHNKWTEYRENLMAMSGKLVARCNPIDPIVSITITTMSLAIVSTAFGQSLICDHHQCNKTSSIDSQLKACNCDPHCYLYGDCCLDSNLGKSSIVRKIQNQSWKHWQCTTLRLISESIHVLTISECAKFWPRKPSDSIKGKCESTSDTSDDPFLSVPIYSRKTHHNYRNLYCAVCNYDTTHSYTWDTFSVCVKNDSLGRCSKSFVYFQKPKDIDLHECYPTDFDSCPREAGLTEDSIKCGLFFAPIKLSDGFLAKNEYCAKCNNHSLKGAVCPESRPHFDRPPLPIGTGRHFSYPVILDIDFTAGGLIVGTQQRCPPNHVYDPWKRACRVVTCDRDRTLQGDACVPSYSEANQTSVFKECPKVTLGVEEYQIFPNGTAYIPSREASIEPGHYRIDSKSMRLSICAHSHVILVGKFSSFQDYLSKIGISISILSLFMKIILFFFGSGPRRTANIVILFLCVSLLLAQSLFLFGIDATGHNVLCQLIGVSMHYLFLATFFWMNVLSYDIFCTFSMERLVPQVKISSTRQLISYSLYGWLTPFTLILVSISFDHYGRSFILAPNYGYKMCWISNRLALLVFFAIPVAILLITNTVFFAFTATRINKISKIGKLARENVAIRRKTFIIYIKLFLIMGLTWIFGFVAAYANNSFLWSLFIVFNSLQGFYILIAFNDLKLVTLMNIISGPLRRVSTSNSSIATVTTISTEQ